MKKEVLFSMTSPFRDEFRILGYRFGKGRKSIAIVGSIRGDEIHQQYVCSQLVRQLKEIERRGEIIPGHEILVIPSANPFSMNIGTRFWAMDNTDINRMFPGYDGGETTQRIAAGLFDAVRGYKFGVQLASYYIPGEFVPHIRIMQTGYEDAEMGKRFGLPYVCVHEPLPFDTTLLNYNWQIWNTKAYSLYTGESNRSDLEPASENVETLLRFMRRTNILKPAEDESADDCQPKVIDEATLVLVKSPAAGILRRTKSAGERVSKGEVAAQIIDPYEGGVVADIKSPVDGVVFFAYNKSLASQNVLLFKILKDGGDAEG